ncbi:hypothetical protein [Mycobacterium intracellulare]|uniref:hypothetical protein n=1 Tax=Mycobacterium intracellulare TaxID=1767 RepID=UPI000BAAD091|nr:hypothetical protein [Mycobacterium intracellulare]ASW94270.1 hypothetical protein CKJ67_05570 [Mycobacterium intracellulare]MCA2356822.1 hypothetical protein [Mycobacterium intracellulare]MCA2367740.1 hypothetical protein [Mycobacterium intracellulare]MDM3899101.1 hypothetical protein [Mycobacterium intracellulare]PBA32351.1 hypothetical protein CKJ65_06140 [Mycobacterium intracellulare]
MARQPFQSRLAYPASASLLSTRRGGLAVDPGCVFVFHVDAGLQIHPRMILPDPPKHLLRREDLSSPVEESQHALPNTRQLA